MASRPRRHSLRLLTWNIHKGIGGLDRRYELDRVIEVIRHHAPDVVVLQEVDSGVPRSRRDEQCEQLAEALDFEFRAFAPNVRLTEGRYGNATLSRFPILRTTNVDLTFPMKKRRSALFTELRATRRRRVQIFNVHLGLSGVERRWQIARLLGSPVTRGLGARHRLVIAGDTNDWALALYRAHLRKAGFDCATGVGRRATRTFPAWRPVGALDRVFTRGAIVGRHHQGSRLRLAREASDHLPVIVDFDVGRL